MFNIYGAHAVYVCVFPHTLSLSHSISLHLSLCLSASLTNSPLPIAFCCTQTYLLIDTLQKQY